MSPAPVIIAIDGRSGAGKTTIAIELAASLRAHHKVSLFHLEDIYPGWNGLAAGVERYITTVLAPLRSGQGAEWVTWDWEKHYDGDVRVTLPAEIVIVEGVGAASDAARPLLDAVVWTEAPDDERRARALSRDGSTYEPYWDLWAAQEVEWLAADAVLENIDVRVLNRADGNAPGDVLRALQYLPSCSGVLLPELSTRRGLKLRAQRIDAEPDAMALYETLYGASTNAVWLDSSDGPDLARDTGSSAGAVGASPAAERRRFSILADDGGSHGQMATHRNGITTVSTGCATARIEGPFFRWLDAVWGSSIVPAPEGYGGEFTLGWLGYLGYELKRETGGSNAGSPTPDSALIFAGRAVVLDHRKGSVWLFALEAPDAAEWVSQAAQAVTAASGAAGSTAAGDGADAGVHAVELSKKPGVGGLEFTARDTEVDYKHKIGVAQHEIAEGNSYEICLTTALHAHGTAVDPWQTYVQLRQRNPAPFGSLLRFGSLSVASTSPERFLRITSAGSMRAEPIKGTRGRSLNAEQDAALRADLESSPKDRAENIMIVDLLRNDLSHFAEPGSVTVSRLCVVESYATVHQLVSTIDAQLLPGASRAEAVAACFPAGSMTGAPKISTMAILDRLEEAPRGVYSGAIGYFSLNGATDLAVAIRTLVIRADGDGRAELSLGVGGAITADSSPQEEYEEIRTKAYGVLSTLGAEFPG
ncbi:chorismate-binding protein [Arthrobacter sp.]|uniref:chorismate-binding protein n=1 Tax=Arthrobacter sp. TaxID=1667 RepID=UPI0028116EBF|nr:chorismate-binding protein [Arthrobacter sp.]